MRSAVLTQSTRVTDGQTELAWHIRTVVYAVARKNHGSSMVFLAGLDLNIVNTNPEVAFGGPSLTVIRVGRLNHGG